MPYFIHRLIYKGTWYSEVIMKRRLLSWLLRYLKIRCWGVTPEQRLPPEFVITKHAYDRIDLRIYGSNGMSHEQWAIFAWEDGRVLTDEQARANRSQYRNSFHKIIYKGYGKHVFVFGLYYSKRDFTSAQKWLVTVYPI